MVRKTGDNGRLDDFPKQGISESAFPQRTTSTPAIPRPAIPKPAAPPSDEPRRPSLARLLGPIRKAAWAAALLLAGWFARDLEPRAGAAPRGTDSLYSALGEFARVVYHVQRDYVEPIDGRQAVYRAIQGLLSSLDPHSRFFPKEQAARLRAATTGVTGSVGVRISRSGGQCIVTGLLPGSPAARAGVRLGWFLVTVQGHVCGRLSEAQATSLLQGPVGSTVNLVFSRPSGGDVSMALKRALTRIPAVESAPLTRDLGYIRIRVFQPGTAHMVRSALGKLRRRAKITGLILDLRGNPGGLFSEGMAVADLFVPKGLLVTRKLRGGRVERMWATDRDTNRDLSMVVLADRKTASAAELTAAALRDNHRALLVGTKTYGKGSIQELVSFPEGSALKLTVGRYYTPKGRAVDGRGLEPDVRVVPGMALALPVPDSVPSWARSDSAIRTAIASLSNRSRIEREKEPHHE